MTTIKTFDRANLKAIAADIDAALAEVAKKYGLETLKGGAVTFGAGSFTMKVEGKSSVGSEQEKAMFVSMAKSYGLDPEILSFDGFRLVGFDAKRRAKPWMIRKDGDPEDKTYITDLRGAQLRFTPKAADAA